MKTKQQAAGAKTSAAILDFVKSNISIVVLLFLIVLGTVLSENFLTSKNLLNVLRQCSIIGIIAAGFTFVRVSGGMDLSLGSTVSLCAVLAMGTLKSSGNNVLLAAAVSLLAGAGAGFLNGTLLRVIRGDVSDTYLITLGTSLVGSSLAYTYSKGYNIYPKGESVYRFLGIGSFMGIPMPAVIMIVVLVVLHFVLKKTGFGRKVLMIGGNREACYMTGINVHRIRTCTFVIAGVCAAIAAIVLTARTNAAAPTSGTGYEFDAIIATIVGGNTPDGLRGSMVLTFAGILIFSLITNIMNLMSVDVVLQTILKGIILALALWANRLREGRGN